MEKRRVTIYIAHRPYSFYSTDTDEYIHELEEKANQVLRETASATHSSIQASAVLTVVSLADEILRKEKEAIANPENKTPRRHVRPRGTEGSPDHSQMTIWDLP